MNSNKSYFLIIGLVIFFLCGWAAANLYRIVFKPTLSLVSIAKLNPLEKYTIDNLSLAQIQTSSFVIENVIADFDTFTSYQISFSFDPTLSGQEPKKVTGLMNIPKGDGPYPIVIMYRGYVDQKAYKTGDGTRRAGEYFAKNGYITIAPDFLGFGQSDKEADSIFESRFQTYTTALTSLYSVPSVDKWDGMNIFVWGHSNGGQIALTVLEITKGSYPTVLWAPVSKPFPYSVLYYTDESDDGGKLIRNELSKFEEYYDVEKFSLTNYLDRVVAPVELHQGMDDNAVPYSWSDLLASKLAKVMYYQYPGADHNLSPSWNQAVKRSLDFFDENTSK